MHVMLDLETLGTFPGCAILSIGAVAFSPTEIIDTFEQHISAKSCQQAGLFIEADTFMWWMRQSDQARRALIAAEVSPLTEVLTRFIDWMLPKTPISLWSKGPSFDAAILARAYRAAHLAPPWHYANERCVRTICDLADVNPGQYSVAEYNHQAVQDALSQVYAVQLAMKRLDSVMNDNSPAL